MNWWRYEITWNGRSQQVIRPMTAGQAAELGAELVPDFDPAPRVADLVSILMEGGASRYEDLIVTFPPEGGLETACPLSAEVPAGRRA